MGAREGDRRESAGGEEKASAASADFRWRRFLGAFHSGTLCVQKFDSVLAHFCAHVDLKSQTVAEMFLLIFFFARKDYRQRLLNLGQENQATYS